MGWIFDHIGFIVFLVIATSVVRNIRAALKRAGDQTNRRSSARPIANVDPEEADRVRRIQEEIRRKIAERRGGDRPASIPPVAASAEHPPLLRPSTVPPIDPFGGTIRRVLTEIERRAQAPAQTPPPFVPERAPSQAAQLERQKQLAEQLRVLEESRLLVKRRADQTVAAQTAHSESEAGMLTASRGGLLANLRDPDELRRAFVLREILGAPVGLR
jgi:hypothetical protein